MKTLTNSKKRGILKGIVYEASTPRTPFCSDVLPPPCLEGQGLEMEEWFRVVWRWRGSADPRVEGGGPPPPGGKGYIYGGVGGVVGRVGKGETGDGAHEGE